MRVDGSDFVDSFVGMGKAIEYVRKKRAPILVHAKCPLLGHHTYGVRKEWYRGDNLDLHQQDDPLIKFEKYLLDNKIEDKVLSAIKKKSAEFVEI